MLAVSMVVTCRKVPAIDAFYLKTFCGEVPAMDAFYQVGGVDNGLKTR